MVATAEGAGLAATAVGGTAAAADDCNLARRGAKAAQRDVKGADIFARVMMIVNLSLRRLSSYQEKE